MSDTQEKRKKRILLVDDDGVILESWRTILCDLGYEVRTARDGNRGLEDAENWGPDLVILDLLMPKRSGFLVLENLRRTKKYPVKVVMITANSGNRHQEYAETLGVDAYLRKPFESAKLISIIENLIGKADE